MRRTPPAPRGVIGAAVLIAVGVAFLLAAVGLPDAEGGRYLFLALGIAFAAAYAYGTRQYVYLFPAGVLCGFGLGLLLPAWLRLSSDFASPVFLGTLALGLVAVFLLAPDRRVPLIPAAILTLVAVADVFLRIDLIPAALQPYFVPAILVAVGAYLLVERRAR
jgi:hypothetical protein